MSEELIINESNFSQYFFDVRMHKPERGQVMARYTSSAEFIEGKLKTDIIDLLYNRDDKAIPAMNVMRKLGCATERDSIRICKEITQDLLDGMKPEEVEKKVYKYIIEVFYYTKQEYVPENDIHWSVIGLKNLEEFLDMAGNKLKIEGKVLNE